MKMLTGAPVTVIEPSPYLSESCRERGIPVIEKFLEDVNKNDLPKKKKYLSVLSFLNIYMIQAFF